MSAIILAIIFISGTIIFSVILYLSNKEKMENLKHKNKIELENLKHKHNLELEKQKKK